MPDRCLLLRIGKIGERHEIDQTPCKQRSSIFQQAVHLRGGRGPACRGIRPGRQGAFTYFFLKGLMGEGDKNQNGWVDTLEAYEYARDKLEALGMEQNPQMSVPTAIPLSRVK